MSFIKAVRYEDDPKPTQDVLPPGRGQWEATAYAVAALNAECEQIRNAQNGTRNDTLNRAAFSMAQLIAGGEISAELVQNELVTAARAAGLGDAEIARTIRSGFARGQQTPRTGRTRHPEPTPTAPHGPTDPGPDPKPRFINWDALWADEGRVEWLAEPILPAGRLISLYSPPGVGKSLLALELAVAISRGTQALGGPTTKVPVLYLDYENVDLDVRDRLQDMERTPGDLRNLHYWQFPDIHPLDTPQGGQALLAAAQDVQAGLVVIDTLSRCVQGEENESSTMLNLYRCTLMPLKAAGIAVLRLDHTGKDETRGQRGTSAKSGDVDLVWRYTEIVPDETFLLSNEKHRIRINETRLNIRRTKTPTTHAVDTRTTGDAKREAILACLDRAGLPLATGRDVARRTLDAEGLKCSNEILSKLLRQRQGLPALDQEQT